MLNELLKLNHLTVTQVLDQTSAFEHSRLAATSEAEADYEELSEQELISMMDIVPLLPADHGWDQDLKTMVLPLSLDDYMDCFWADEAPFFIPGHLTGPEDRIVNYTNWLEPTHDDAFRFSTDVIAYRMVEKDLQDSLYTRIWSTINSI